jgi:hypothetical protein
MKIVAFNLESPGNETVLDYGKNSTEKVEFDKY